MAKKSTKKGSKPTREETYEITPNVTITCYEWDNRTTAKLTIANAFVIFCTIVDHKDEYFLSYPSYKNKKEEWQNLAYCFDKKINAKLTKVITEFMDGEDEDDE